MPKKLSEWNKFVKCHAGMGKSIKKLSKEYKMSTGRGLTGGGIGYGIPGLSGGKRHRMRK